jgi:hypothetical protein
MSKILAIIIITFGVMGVALSDEKRFPPIPKWKPAIAAPLSDLLGRMIYYTDGKRDIVMFKHGTMVVLPDGLNDDESKKYALEVLSKIINYHPDMNPLNMDDGNILVQYNHPAYNVVISSFTDNHMEEIRNKHIEALAESEVLITPLGNNKFDEFGMKALYGRAFMFMDAQKPEIVKVHRKNASNDRVESDIPPRR